MEWIEKIPEFLKMSWSEISKVMAGVFLTGFMAVGWVRQVKISYKNKLKAMQAENKADVEAALAEANEKLAELSKQHAAETVALHQKVADLQHQERCAQA